MKPDLVIEKIIREKLLNQVRDPGIIIIFNSGGWGRTPLERASDFVSVVKGIKQTLNDWGYHTSLISYARTEGGLSGKLEGIKGFFTSFKFSSKALADQIEFLAKKLPEIKIIIVGLSGGGAFVNETMKRISQKNQIYAITAGIPFWYDSLESENILHLNNNGKDRIATGGIEHILSALIKAPFIWIRSKITGENLAFPLSFQVQGHKYFWDFPEVNLPIVNFLEEKINN